MGIKVAKKRVSTQDYSFGSSRFSIPPNHPLHVGDSMDKNLHSTGKQEGLRGVKTKMGITAQPTMLNIYDPGQLPLWYSLALHGAGEVKFATSGWKITDDLTDLRSLV